jgi:hypothetical protein
MPRLSAFTPFGQWKFSGSPSHVEELYGLLKTLWGPAIDFTQGTPYDEPYLYSVARILALALKELEHAGNQAYPNRAYDLIPLLEADFVLVPGPKDGVSARQAAIAAAMLLPRGETAANVVNASRALVGASFLSYVPGPPNAGGDFGFAQSLFTDVRVPPRYLQLVDPWVNGTSSWVGYQNLDATIATPITLNPGDQVLVDAGNSAQMERVTVAATAGPSNPPPMTTPGVNYFEAIFTKAHGVGATVVAGNHPVWSTITRQSYLVVTVATSTNASLRGKLNALMTKIARAVETFYVVQPTSTTATGGTIGPLTVDAPMGAVTIGATNYTNSM